MKLLYVTDTHIRGTPPQHRTDDFAATLAAKLAEVVELAARHRVQAILHGGDLFDRPDVAPAVARAFLDPLRRAPCPIFGIAGNHDVFGHNPETLARTMVGLFDGFGLFRLIRPGQVVWLEEGGMKVQVTGQEFHYDIDRRDPRLDYCVYPVGDPGAPAGHQHFRHPEARWAIHLTHGMLLERPFFQGIPCTTLDQVMAHTAADVTLGAHYHPGWSRVWERDGRYFANPGALVRLGVGAADVNRTPQVLLIELTPSAVRLEPIPLRSAPPGEAVLDRSHLEAEARRHQALADFLQGVRGGGDLALLDLESLVAAIADHAGVPPAVRQEALARIAQAQELLARGDLDEE